MLKLEVNHISYNKCLKKAIIFQQKLEEDQIKGPKKFSGPDKDAI